jgi:hypothetical protein
MVYFVGFTNLMAPAIARFISPKVISCSNVTVNHPKCKAEATINASSAEPSDTRAMAVDRDI